jgi:hypothetical protein
MASKVSPEIDRRRHQGPFRFLYMDLKRFFSRLLGRG